MDKFKTLTRSEDKIEKFKTLTSFDFNKNEKIFFHRSTQKVLQVTGVVLPVIPEVPGGGTILTWFESMAPKCKFQNL